MKYMNLVFSFILDSDEGFLNQTVSAQKQFIFSYLLFILINTNADLSFKCICALNRIDLSSFPITNKGVQ